MRASKIQRDMNDLCLVIDTYSKIDTAHKIMYLLANPYKQKGFHNNETEFYCEAQTCILARLKMK